MSTDTACMMYFRAFTAGKLVNSVHIYSCTYLLLSQYQAILSVIPNPVQLEEFWCQ